MVDFASARRMMVDNQLRTTNITDHRLLAALGSVPRELFVPEERRQLAYIDEGHVLTSGTGSRKISAPSPLAKLIQLAEINHTDKVLHVGCNSGYGTAILADLAESVVALDSDEGFVAMAKSNLSFMGIKNVQFRTGPLDAGDPDDAPFNAILIEGAVREVPQTLLDQLALGGRLVAAVGPSGNATANVYVHTGEDLAPRPEFSIAMPALELVKPADEFVF